MAEKIQKVVSVEKIQTMWISSLEMDEMKPASCPSNEDDFIKLIYIRLYGQRKNMGYTIETMEEREANGYRFKDFRIRRREMEYLEGLLQKEKDNFGRVCNRLLGTCFLCKGNQNTNATIISC